MMRMLSIGWLLLLGLAGSAGAQARAPVAKGPPARPALRAELVKQGEVLYGKQVCAACHSTDGSPRAAPSFKGLFGRK